MAKLSECDTKIMFLDALVDNQIVTTMKKGEKKIEDAQSNKAKYPVLLVLPCHSLAGAYRELYQGHRESTFETQG